MDYSVNGYGAISYAYGRYNTNVDPHLTLTKKSVSGMLVTKMKSKTVKFFEKICRMY